MADHFRTDLDQFVLQCGRTKAPNCIHRSEVIQLATRDNGCVVEET